MPSLSGVHPQTPAVPPPPHVSLPAQLPQTTLRWLPQLSSAVTGPQFLPCRAQNVGVLSETQSEQTFGGRPPPPHVAGEVQVPQLTVRDLPQLSGAVTMLQFFPTRAQNAASVSVVQPHTL